MPSRLFRTALIVALAATMAAAFAVGQSCYGGSFVANTLLGQESQDTGEGGEQPQQANDPTPVPTPEPTPVPTPEPTPVPTPVPTVEPTLEPTSEPAPVTTPAPTGESTPVPTPEPTPVPAPEPTPEPPASLPSAPTGLQIDTETGSLDVSLDWDDVAVADSYLVRWRSVDNGEKLNEGVRVSSSEANITVADYGEWVVRVEACNDAGCSPPLSQRFAVEPASVPTPTPTPEPDPTPEPTPTPAPAPAPGPAPTPEPPASLPSAPTGLQIRRA